MILITDPVLGLAIKGQEILPDAIAFYQPILPLIFTRTEG